MLLPYPGRSYRTRIFLYSLVLHGFGLAIPLYMLNIYDRVVPNRAWDTMIWLTVFACLFVAAETLVRTLRMLVVAWHTDQALFWTRRRLVRLFLHRPVPAQKAREAMQAAQSLLVDAYQHQSFYMADLPLGLLYMGVIALIDPGIALFLVMAGLAHLLWLGYQKKGHAILLERTNQLGRQRQQVAGRIIRHMAQVKLLGAEEYMLQHYNLAQGRMSAATEVLDGEEVRKQSASFLLNLGAVFGTILAGAVAVIGNRISLGALTACVLLARRALMPLQETGERWFSSSDRLLARNRLASLGLDTVREDPEPTILDEGLLKGMMTFETRDLVVRSGIPDNVVMAGSTVLQEHHAGIDERWRLYDNDDLVLARVRDFSLVPGKLLSIRPMDPEIAKAFFLVLRGLSPFYSGEIVLGDYLLTRYSGSAVSRKVALLGSQELLLPGTYLENIASFDPALQTMARDTISMVGLEGFFENLDRGLDTQVPEDGGASLGPKILQKLALARALAIRPAVLLLDRFDDVLDADDQILVHEIIKSVQPFMVVIYHGSSTLVASLASHKGVFDPEGQRLEIAFTQGEMPDYAGGDLGI